MGDATGAGAIFGTTGGVMEAALRTASDILEGKNEEEVMKTLELLDLPKDKVTALDVESVYKKYGIDLKAVKVLKF